MSDHLPECTLPHLPEKIKTVLVSNGVDIDGGSFHSWRCFDKERYPEPCDCTDEVVAEIMAVVDDAIRACEERVRHEGLGVCIEHYDAGVAAARQAVAAFPGRAIMDDASYIHRADAIAAIDALKPSSDERLWGEK